MKDLLGTVTLQIQKPSFLLDTMETVLLPDAVVSESVPASSEEELGAWPERPRL